MRRQIEETMGIRAIDIYGLSEVMGPGVASECEHQNGLHVFEDQFIIEIIDPTTLEPVPDGECGEVVFTTLTKEGIPVIRYRTRDISRMIAGECECGRTFRRMERVTGRTDDMLIIRGVNVYPTQIEQVLMGIPGVAPHYQVVLSKRGSMDTVEVQVEVGPDIEFDEIRELEALQKKVAAAIAADARGQRVGQARRAASIQRSEGKAKRVVDFATRRRREQAMSIEQLSVFLQNERGGWRGCAASSATPDSTCTRWSWRTRASTAWCA